MRLTPSTSTTGLALGGLLVFATDCRPAYDIPPRDASLAAPQARDLLEILDDRYGRSSTLVATQVPVEDWHARLADPTLGDGILDRLVHNAYRLELRGESMRLARSPLRSPSG